MPNVKLVELCEYFGPMWLKDGALFHGRIFDSISGTVPNGFLYKIDTLFNVMQKPSLAGYTDSLCIAPVSGQICILPKADTVWLENLNLRNTIKLGINESTSKKIDILIYPNPSNGNFKVGFNKGESGNILVYNAFGQLILHHEFNNKEQIDINIC